ncbi:MAG: ABC transporter permease [Actinomycetota bacterium]
MRELAGLGELIRLIVRRERVVLPVWGLILGLLPVGVAGGFAGLYPTESQIREAATLVVSNPAFVAFLGEVHAPTLGGLTAWRSAVPLAMGVGIISSLAVVRHTRAEEQTGRRELIASTVLGRHAPLAAALAVVGVADLLIGAVTAAGLIGYGLEPLGSLALGASMAAVGWVFAAAAAVAAQLAESSTTSNGLAMTAVGTAFFLRMVGDVGVGTGAEVLSWISPIGLAQRVRPFGEESPGALVALVALATVLAVIAQFISMHRDVGAGLISSRPGPARAGRSLSGAAGLALRLQSGSAISWLVGFAVMGGFIGAMTESFVELMLETPALARIMAAVGGLEAVSDAFLASMLALFGIVAATHGLQAVQLLRAEELGNRAAAILSTPVSRARWLSSHARVALAVPVLDLAVGGAAAGLGYGTTVGDPAQAVRLAGAALVSVPAAWLMVGFSLFLFGYVAWMSRLAWTVLAAAGLLTLLGRALGLAEWVLDLSPFSHIPPMPGGDLAVAPLAWMTLVAAGLCAAAFVGFNRRDVQGG